MTTRAWQLRVVGILVMVLLAGAARAQVTLPPVSRSYNDGGFGYLTGLGNGLANVSGLGIIPTPLYVSTASSAGGCGGTCGYGVPQGNFRTKEALTFDSTGLVKIVGTDWRDCDDTTDANCLLGHFVCSRNIVFGVFGTLTGYFNCTLTITGGTGAYQNAIGSGTINRTYELFPLNSVFIVDVFTEGTSISYTIP